MTIRGLPSLAVAQALALLAALASAALYARWLDPPTLAAWALALAGARAALLLLDAGLKTALVRREEALEPAAVRRLQRAVTLGAAVLVLLAAAVAQGPGPLAAAVPSPALLLTAVAAYGLSHAALLPALVQLERSGRFDAVGRAEAAGTLVEFGAPALLLALGVSAIPALAAGVVGGRAVRAAMLVSAAAAAAPAPGRPGKAAGLLREGLQLQAVALLSMARDTLHLWIVGPWFGAAWAGAYAFAMMACMVASQALVGMAARVALPALRAAPEPARAGLVARALRWLAAFVLPPLVLLALLPLAEPPWLSARWHDAMTVLPALVLRVVLTLPLALLGPWLLLVAEPARTLRVHVTWTTLETASTVVAVAALGPIGLAAVWPFGGALGLCLYAQALARAGVRLGPLAGLVLRGPGWGQGRA